MSNKFLGMPEPRGIITEEHLHNWTYPAGKEKMLSSGGGNNDLIMAKVIAIVVLGAGSFFLGLIPVKLAKWFDWKLRNAEDTGNHLVISLLLCFGGGVLMFTTFLHLQPEVREAVETLIETGVVPEFGHDAKLAELIFCMGFFFVYLIEEIVHGILDRKRDHNEDEAILHRTVSLRRCSKRSRPETEETGPTLIPRVSLVQGNDAKPLDTNAKSNSTQILLDSLSVSTIHETNATDSTFIESNYSSKFSPLDPETQMTGGPLSLYSYGKNNEKSDDDSSRKSYFENEYGKSEDKANNHRHHHRSHSHMLFEDDSDSSSSEESNKLGKTFRGFFTILALSFHAVFEGLAVGLETRVNNVWYLLLAVATHKFVISFCVGVDLLSTRTKTFLMVVYVATFAIVSPLGIGIGIALSDDSSSSGGDLTTVILQGMAAGTLLYVVFFEVLQRERANSQSGVLQLIAIMAGFGVMFALQVITGHEHHHGHELDVHVTHVVTTSSTTHSEHGHSH